MLVVCIRSYLKSFLRHKVLILDTYHPDTLYLREQGCEDLWLFFKAKMGPRANKVGKHWFEMQRNAGFRKKPHFKDMGRKICQTIIAQELHP